MSPKNAVHKGHLPPNPSRIPPSSEFFSNLVLWRSGRGPGFFPVVLFGSSPSPLHVPWHSHHVPPHLSSLCVAGKICRFYLEGEEGVGAKSYGSNKPCLSSHYSYSKNHSWESLVLRIVSLFRILFCGESHSSAYGSGSPSSVSRSMEDLLPQTLALWTSEGYPTAAPHSEEDLPPQPLFPRRISLPSLSFRRGSNSSASCSREDLTSQPLVPHRISLLSLPFL